MDAIAVLRNPIQAYAWGSRTAIPELLGLEAPSAHPAAELWMGAHPNAPSQVRVDGQWQPLDQVIERDPTSVLGKEAAERFSNRLPFLFKVLAADQPLSIQVHPNVDQARAGFEMENRLGIPLKAAHRNYRDPNHKPELLCAVTRFEALKGFRHPKGILALMSRVADEILCNELTPLQATSDGTGLRDFYSSLLSMDALKSQRIFETAVREADRHAKEDRAFEWVVKLSHIYPGDMGVLSPLIFNLVHLEPGEAVFIPAGVLHSYLRGVGVELMANSDNVLRAGLTPKHVDIPEVLKIVDFTPCEPEKVMPHPGPRTAEQAYPTPAEEFQLSAIQVSPRFSFLNDTDRSADILICMKGKALVRTMKRGDFETAEKGISLLIPSAAGPYQITGEATLYKATVGLPQGVPSVP